MQPNWRSSRLVMQPNCNLSDCLTHKHKHKLSVPGATIHTHIHTHTHTHTHSHMLVDCQRFILPVLPERFRQIFPFQMRVFYDWEDMTTRHLGFYPMIARARDFIIAQVHRVPWQTFCALDLQYKILYVSSIERSPVSYGQISGGVPLKPWKYYTGSRL